MTGYGIANGKLDDALARDARFADDILAQHHGAIVADSYRYTVASPDHVIRSGDIRHLPIHAVPPVGNRI